MNFDPREIFHRHFVYLELDIGRHCSENPRLIQSLTVYRVYDPNVNAFRPIAVPFVQIFDPYRELNFHSGQPIVSNPIQFSPVPVIEPPTPLQYST